MSPTARLPLGLVLATTLVPFQAQADCPTRADMANGVIVELATDAAGAASYEPDAISFRLLDDGNIVAFGIWWQGASFPTSYRITKHGFFDTLMWKDGDDSASAITWDNIPAAILTAPVGTTSEYRSYLHLTDTILEYQSSTVVTQRKDTQIGACTYDAVELQTVYHASLGEGYVSSEYVYDTTYFPDLDFAVDKPLRVVRTMTIRKATADDPVAPDDPPPSQ